MSINSKQREYASCRQNIDLAQSFVDNTSTKRRQQLTCKHRVVAPALHVFIVIDFTKNESITITL